jgi:triosephosphate isomerase (TIM)
MSRTPLLAGNWKMYGTRAEAHALASALVAAVGDVTTREVMIAPPFTALEAVATVLAGTRLRLGAQNLHWETTGAFTGEIAAPMLREAGCSHVIIGHSERRQYFAETDETVNRRLGAALAGGLTPVVCVGETLDERESGRTEAVVTRQLRGGLAGCDTAALGSAVIAYEPVWAIGTGRTATPEQAQAVHALIRRELGALAGAPLAAGIRVLYGGSVKPDNVDALMAQPDIDGALVGGASLDAASFTRIVRFEG